VGWGDFFENWLEIGLEIVAEIGLEIVPKID
jgi:hypothetical protein